MAVRERLPKQQPDFYHYGNLKLVPTLDKRINNSPGFCSKIEFSRNKVITINGVMISRFISLNLLTSSTEYPP
jgi:hypothetical protein